MKLIYLEDKKLFLCKCSYFERRVPRDAGFSYSSKSKLWYTQSPDDAIKLYKYADEDLQEKFDQYKRWRQKKIRQSTKASSDFEVPKPKGLEHDYFPFQKAGIEYAMDRRFTLIADDMGLGKTIQAIGVLNKLNESKDINRVMILCPNTMKGVWKKELEKWMVPDLSMRVNNSADFELDEIMITNYEAFRFQINPNAKGFRDPKKGKYNNTLEIFKDLKKMDNIDLLILDESHRIKNYSANTTRNVFKLKSQIGVEKALFLTGTPIFSRPDEIWTTIKFFDCEDTFKGTKQDFVEYYQDAYFDTRYKRMVYGEPKHLDELQRLLRTNFMIRRTKEQVFEEMPDKIRKIVPVEIADGAFDHLEGIIEDMHNLSSLASQDEIDPNQNILSSLRTKHIDELADMRMITGQQKVRATVEYVQELIDAGEKVIIFGHHKKVLHALKKKFPNCAFITGDTPSEDRVGEVEKFQNDPDCMVFIGNMQSAGVGITLTASCHVVFVEMDFVPANMIQAEDRAYRYGQDKTVFIHLMVAENTLDPYIANMIIDKQEIFDKMIEHERLKE